jgi:hypothetical protein
MNLFRGIDAKLRRASEVPPQREVLPRAAKRARTIGDLVPLIPKSMAHSSPPQATDATHSTNLCTKLSTPSSIPTPEIVFNSTGQFKNRQPDALMESAGSEETIEPQPKPAKSRRVRGKKRGTEDDEFSQSHDTTDSSEDLIPPENLTKKSERTRKRDAATRKSRGTVYYVNNQLHKPEPHGQPEIWANKRQQLCETLPYYRAYQTGIYMSDGIAYGHLIDKEVDARDKFDEQIVITSV